MVKIPEKSPDWQNLITEKFQKIIKLFDDEEIQKLITKSDRLYYYWDKIRCQPISPKFDRKEIWAIIRFRRKMMSSASPIEDIKGVPFTFWLTENIQEKLHLIDSSLSGSMTNWSPNEDKRETTKHIVSSLLDESITSSQIEGAVTTIKDAKKMLLEKRTPKNKSEQMIYNNYLTMQSIKEACKRDLNLETLLDFHVSITKDTLDSKDEEGRFRTSENQINVSTNYGEVLFIPPPAEEIKGRIEALIAFANDEKEKSFIHPVIKAIFLHFWMAYIHPFTDGNGRMARTLFYWYMLKHDYWIFEFTSISKAILKRTSKYAYAYLYTEHDDNDLTYFINFHIDIIIEAIDELKKHIQEEKRKTSQLQLEFVQFPDLNLRQINIIHHIISHPNEILTIKIHQHINKIAYQTARTDLIELAKKGWLKSLQKGKKFYFLPTDSFWGRLKNMDI